MKTIPLHHQTNQLIADAVLQKREAQQRLFEQYSPKMLGVCRQYVKDLHHAEDLMLQGFLKVFTSISQFKNEGNFEGWIRRIMVNTCITYLRKKHPIQFSDDEFVFDVQAVVSMEGTELEDIQKLIDELPTGYKMVFNLYAIEGYKHSEIAKELNITENTSKSQLFKARKWLQENYIIMNRTVNGDK
ncbi:sigma-70 family RNA polymerase sigma factor [Wenyingzhuangia sp. chi5]|uniref:Sigma-70 family RNA polymerase sigma factor n=1 Tax=Wenyingzhuangia gilva TaxID=3057677 RepID=A0ABT8VR88_9FLAO|nr:sigma-70 family RNA polymerase sigma factor [Wenyingzhuangia sp. chi5]MDO3694490.1 sigma-70 family RNA polymerase sigma factor [Wenyingzhuangia sp. chi5]